MALKDGTLVVADKELMQAVDYALTLKYNEEPQVQGRRRRSSVNDAGASLALSKHPFDAQIINKGSEENPDYYVRIYDSSMPDSPYAGIIIIYDWSVYVPVTEVKVTTQDSFYVVLDITYTGSGDPPFSIPFSLLPYGSGSDVGYLTQREYIAQGKIPNVASLMSGNIQVNNRWA